MVFADLTPHARSLSSNSYSNKASLCDWQLFVNGHVVSTNVSLNDGNWNHLCASWTSVGGEWKVYINGTQRAAGRGLARGAYILTGGLLVLGTSTTSVFTGKHWGRSKT